MDALRARTVSGLKWSGTAQIVRQGLGFALAVFLARLLTPEDFGLMGMIVVFTGFAGLFGEMGLGAAIVQKAELERHHLDTIFWVNVLTGALLTTLLIVAAPAIAAFYDEPLLGALTTVVAANFLLASFTIVQRNLLLKRMDFKRLFFVDTTAIVLAGLIAVGLAWRGFGVWSLAAQSLLSTGVTVVMLWLGSNWRPRPHFSRRALGDVVGFSSNLLGFNVLNYWTRNLDNVLIGRFIGSAPLGIYTRAYSLMLLPISQVTSVFTQVMFPALSAIQQDLEKVKRVYLRATRTISLITFPLMLGLLVLARPFILVLYGEKWAEVIPIFQLFCLTGTFQAIGNTVGWLYQSQGRTDTQFRWGIYAFVIRALAFVIGLRWGIRGVAIAYVASNYLFLMVPNWIIAGRLINMRLREMVVNLAGTFLAAVVMAVAVWALGFLLPVEMPHLVRLLVQAFSGIVVYGSLVHGFRLRAYVEARELLMSQAPLRAFRTGRLPLG